MRPGPLTKTISKFLAFTVKQKMKLIKLLCVMMSIMVLTGIWFGGGDDDV
jgi:hypothetical protein